MKRKLMLVVGLVMSAFLSVSAAETTVTWTNTTSASSSWGVESNWNDAGGNVPALAPTNGENIVFAALPAAKGGVQITTEAFSGNDTSVYLSYPAVNPTVGTMTGGALYEIMHGSYRNVCQKERPFTIGDPSGFLGYWNAGDYRTVFALAPAAGATQKMSTLTIANRPMLQIASGTVELDEAMGCGTLDKRGAGELVLKGTAGQSTTVIVKDGGVTFDTPVGGLEAALAKAALHLDASDDTTLVKSNADGRVWITRWDDVRKNGNCALRDTYKNANPGSGASAFYPYCNPGYLSDETTPTGLRAVSFGSSGANISHGTTYADGPSNCCLALDREYTGIREALYVVRTPHTPGNSTILGHTSSHHFLAEGGMFSDYAQYDAEAGGNVYRLRDGEMRHNGIRRPFEDFRKTTFYTAQTGFCVIGLSLSHGGSTTTLGSRAHQQYYSGGSRIGEVLLFTNVLTKAEKALLNNYLMAKWITGGVQETTAANLIVSVTNTASHVGVASGKTASVLNAYLPNGKLVKTGSGSLAVERLYPDNVAVEVQGGEVAFGSKDSAVPTNAPAANPWIWLDARKTTSLTEQDQDVFQDKTFVKEWKDCRDEVDRKATCPWSTIDSTSARVPTLAAFDGRPVVDFGISTTPCQTRSAMLMASAPKSYAGFIAIRCLNSANDGALFGSSAVDSGLYRFTYPYHGSIGGEWYMWPGRFAATWTINGSPRDAAAYSDPDVNQSARMFILAFSSDRPFPIDQIAQLNLWSYSNSADYGGRIQVGEMILYDRPITEAERRQTEAYLMANWLGRPHPAAEKTTRLASIKFADDIAPVIATEETLEVGSVDGGTGAFVKKGAGSVTLAMMAKNDDIESLEVASGSLTLNYDLATTPVYHFDAMDADSLKTEEYTPEDGGVLRTNVTVWTDTDNASVTASYQAAYDYDTVHQPGDPPRKCVLAAPTLQQIEVRPGIVRPVVEFGAMGGPNTGNLENGRYGTKDASAMFFSIQPTNLRELFTVVGDSTTTRRQALVTGRGSMSFYRDFVTAGGILHSSYSSASVRDGKTYVDGEEVNPVGTSYPTGIHLASFVSTAGVSSDAFCYLANGQYTGGLQIGESFAFSKVLGDAERANLTAAMMHKWFGEEYLVGGKTLPFVKVAAGAVLTVSGPYRPTLSVAEIIGSGTVNVDAITDLAAVSVAFTAPDACESLTLNAAVSFADAVTVTVDLAGFGKVEEGTYPLVTADAVADVDLAGWTLDVVGTSNRSFALVKNGTSICLKVSKPGALILVR